MPLLSMHDIQMISLSINKESNEVANLFNSYVLKSCNRVCKLKKKRKLRKRKFRRVDWFDQECRNKRRDAIKAGERVFTEADKINLITKTKAYKTCTQQKKRQSKLKRRSNLVNIFKKDASSIWAEINKKENIIEDDDNLKESLLNHFKEIGDFPQKTYFDGKHLHKIESFLKDVDYSKYFSDEANSEISEILNRNFSVEELSYAIDSLKNKKSPGVDAIPAEMIKFCRDKLIPDLHLIFNYMLEKREFPKVWAEGLKSAIYKAGLRNVPSNYRGITVLGIFAKIFEILVNNRFEFVNEAFNKVDPNNGGFLKGKRTTDNIFILNGLVQRQLNLNKALYVCFVDFSKAFDLVNRDILFFKLINSGWSGRLLDTVRDLYSKTSFRMKFEGYISANIPNSMGVNQGGNASGFLFRKYLSDLSNYLYDECGVCLGESVIAHLLWADDMILFSDSISGLQKQLDGLFKFCSENMMIVNDLKTKLMVFGNGTKKDIIFNGTKLKWVEQYKYLGNIITSINRVDGDIFKNNYDYLSDKARKAIFAFFKKTKTYGRLPPSIMLKAFTTLIQPILVYGSDIWGCSNEGGEIIDKVCLWFIRCILRVKQSTNKLMCYGDIGLIPPSIRAHINVILFHVRVFNMCNSNESNLVKTLHDDLARLHDVGFKNCLSKALDLAKLYNIDLQACKNTRVGKESIKSIIMSHYRNHWQSNVADSSSKSNSSLRLYKTFKTSFVLEPYLLCVPIDKHRLSLSRFRCSSHFLEIERARHQNKIPPIWDRLCPHCKFAVDDELHLLLFCKSNMKIRKQFLASIVPFLPNLAAMHHEVQFSTIMSCTNNTVIKNLAKFIYNSLETRKKLNVDKC